MRIGPADAHLAGLALGAGAGSIGSTMRTSTPGTGGPTDQGLRLASSPLMTVATDDVSVSP